MSADIDWQLGTPQLVVGNSYAPGEFTLLKIGNRNTATALSVIDMQKKAEL